MKKRLQIKRTNEELEVMEGEKKLFSILKDNSVSGQNLYESIFKSLAPNENVEITVDGRDDLQRNDKIIFDRFNELIQKICQAINISNNKPKENENNEF